jgi:hypothetical protein
MTDVAAARPANINDDVASDIAPAVDPVTLFGSEQQELFVRDQLYATESLRQDRLQAEFDAEFNMDLSTTALFDEDAFGFRMGADGSATLPSFFASQY